MPAIRLADFDTWRPGYGLASVRIVRAGTDNLADVFTDEDLSVSAANPQTLLERTEDDVSYGKWATALYVGEAVQLQIDSIDQTGTIRPPLTALEGEDASEAVVTAEGGSESLPLSQHLARRIDVRDFGDFLAVGEVGASAAANGLTLLAALNAAGAAGGGYVELPAGTYAITPIALPTNVVARGQGRVATTLQCNQATDIVTVSGDKAGLSRLTLDGISLVSGSIGIAALAKDQIILDDVEIKRFGTGMRCKGGENSVWRGLHVSDCATGVSLRGDTDSGDSGDGKLYRHNQWRGGRVEFCSTVGVKIEYVDAECAHNVFEGIEFDTNTGTALQIVGARNTKVQDCVFVDNTVNFNVNDGSPANNLTNTIIGLYWQGGLVKHGSATLAGRVENVVFDSVVFDDVDFTLTTPSFNVLAIDCREINDVTLAGVPTRWQRLRRTNRGEVYGVTTNNSATKAWAIALDHGQRCYLEAKVAGRQRNGINTGYYHVSVSAGRPGASLAYDTQTGNFTAGNVLTGATSGATARIAADSDSGTTGTLTLQDVVGTFVDNEVIADGAGGSALVNGSLSANNAALAGSVTAIRAAQETNANWDCTFAANGGEIELRVTGDTSQTVEWIGLVEVVSNP